MKTPREMLLERHRAVAPKLDAVRQSAVAAVCDRRTGTVDAHERRPQAAATSAWHVLWQELIMPSRRIWAGLAAVWLVLAVVNLSQRDHLPAGKVAAAAPVMDFQTQQRWLNELLADRSLPLSADRPKTFLPQPSSKRCLEILTT